MAESKSTVVPLCGSNYPTWKLQCCMTLMKHGLWSIVDGSETAPAEGAGQDAIHKFACRKDKALALSVEPSLLYLLGEPDDPVAVWKKLGDQFQKKSWANKLELRCRLYSLKLDEGGLVQAHIKTMMEVFDGLSVLGDPISDEDRVVYLLASLPMECYSHST